MLFFCKPGNKGLVTPINCCQRGCLRSGNGGSDYCNFRPSVESADPSVSRGDKQLPVELSTPNSEPRACSSFTSAYSITVTAHFAHERA
jgi:hypothetical protein